MMKPHHARPIGGGAAPAALPARGGVGLKPEHFRHVLEARPDIGFFEVHAENYMVAGGPFHHYRRMLLENPATYVEFEVSTMAEADFISEVVARGAGPLSLDALVARRFG